MKLEEAMVYVLAMNGRGMNTDLLAKMINYDRLHVRRDGRPVTSAQVYAAVRRNPAVFVKEGALIHLCM